MRLFLSFLWCLAALALVAGFGGRFHPLGDSLAVGRPAVTVALFLLSILLILAGARRLGLSGLVLPGLAAATMVPLAPAASLPDGVRVYGLYQKNLLWILPDTETVAEDILKTGADFVTLQEMHQRNRPIMERLAEAYPHQQFCPFAAVGGTAVLSRWPLTEAAPLCAEGYGLAAMQVETPDGNLWVAALHLHWPYPFEQAEQLDTLLPVIEGLKSPVVMGGDFNMVPWSFAVREVMRTARTRPAGHPGGTFRLSIERDGRNLAGWLPLLPIDHLLVPETASAARIERRALLGSDHHGLFGQFTLGAPR